PQCILELKEDSRKGVKDLGVKLQDKYEKYLQEIDRIESIKRLEEDLFLQGYRYISGVDEVGRGPLAGPVVSCAVILPIDSKIFHIKDSKKLTSKKREELCEIIQSEAIS